VTRYVASLLKRISSLHLAIGTRPAISSSLIGNLCGQDSEFPAGLID
jgi:hypothetical protein